MLNDACLDVFEHNIKKRAKCYVKLEFIISRNVDEQIMHENMVIIKLVAKFYNPVSSDKYFANA